MIPGLGRFPEGGHGNPLQHCCLENTVDRGAWQATVHGVTESDMTEVTWHACIGFNSSHLIYAIRTFTIIYNRHYAKDFMYYLI